MSRIRRVARNSMMLGFQQVVVNLLSIIVVGYIARKLGKTDYGVFSLAFTFTVFFSFLGHLGLRTLTIREVAREREKSNDYLGKIIPARFVLIALMTAAIPLAAILLKYDTKTCTIAAIAALAAMFEQVSRILSDIFQAHEEMGKVAIRDVAVRIFTGVASIAVLYFGYRLVAVSWIYVLGAIFGLSLNVFLYNNRFSWPKLQFDYNFIWHNIKEGLSFMVLGMATTMYTHVDVLIISKLLDMQAVGIYNASANLFYRLSFVADAVATASFPAIAQLYWSNKSEASNVLSTTFSGILVVSIPIAVGGWMLAGDIIGMIYGDGYASSAIIFKILIASMPFMFLSLQMNYALGAIKLQGLVIKIMVGLLLVNAIANFVLTPVYGIRGAAFATFMTEFVGFAILSGVSVKYFCLSGVVKTIKILLFPLGAMVIVVYFVSIFGPIISIISGALSFAVVFFFVGRNEIYSFYSIMKPKH